MRIRAGIVGAAVLAQALTALGQTSPYSSMAMPGTHNSWDTTPSMALIADNTWGGTQALSSASGQFKFAANNGWANNWGGNAAIARVPAVATAPDPSGSDLAYSGLSNGPYRITFNDSTLEFQMEWAGASPLPPPVITNVALVGDFNNWTTNANSTLTNHPAPNTNLWSVRRIPLEYHTAFRFQLNRNPDNNWGAPETDMPLAGPQADGYASGADTFFLTIDSPGYHTLTFNATSGYFTIQQTTTQSVQVAGMTVQGSFIGVNSPPPNMMKRGETRVWESDHHITNTAAVTHTLRFSANGGIYPWGATNDTPVYSLPAAGAMARDLTNFAHIADDRPGRYRISLNYVSGDFSFTRLYVDNSAGTNVNLIKNPGFEQITNNDPDRWNTFYANAGTVADGYPPHSGRAVGNILGKWYPEWPNYASLSQSVTNYPARTNLIVPGRTYLLSAWLRATPDWTASLMQIKFEWYNAATQQIAGTAAMQNITGLSTNWVRYSVEGVAPAGAVRANVVILCSGSGTAGSMQVDDVEFRIASSRTQDFETWSTLQSFAAFAPDWSITSGRAIWNATDTTLLGGVFFSQYVEGTGNNKAIEIYNGLDEPLDLGTGYALEQYDNASLTPTTTIPLTGSVAAKSTLILTRPFSGSFAAYAPDPAITGLPSVATNKLLTFNGDDVLVLRNPANQVIDRIGQVGTNATGALWNFYTRDRTLRRNPTVLTGTTSAVTAAFPADEWTAIPKDSFAGLGSHELYDPNAAYMPPGYSLLMNTNAILTSSELTGGIGDISFWYRTESASPAVTMVIETAPDSTGPWTEATTLSGIASTEWTYFLTYVNQPDHPWVRIRQTGGAPNRFRIDEILVDEPVGLRRMQTFNDWTNASFTAIGNHSRAGWSIQNARIVTNGVYNTRAAELTPPSGAVLSPVFPEGIGQVSFWARSAVSNTTARLWLQTSTVESPDWTTEAVFTITTNATHSQWLYTTNSTQVRIVFDPGFDNSDVLIDNVEIRLPALFRNQNFDAWPTSRGYTTESYQGWYITNTLVSSENAYEGQAARLNTTVGNFILSPDIPDGLGPIRFRHRRWNDTATPTIQVQVSEKGLSWSTIASVSVNSNTYQEFAMYLDDATNRFVRLYHSAGSLQTMIDDIRIAEPAPRPSVIAVPSIDPEAPAIGDAVQIQAVVLPRDDATLLSVTGFYRIASSPWTRVQMQSTTFGRYAAVSNIPALPAGTDVRYFVQIRYAGLGADPASPWYATNTHTTATNLYQVSSIRRGLVWINELSYLNIDDTEWEEDSEFIELCGKAGANIGNWKIELAFGAAADIAANGSNAVYASYSIPNGTILNNQHKGFGFFVLGDEELQVAGYPINLVLDTTIPEAVDPWAEELRDHIYNGRGVIRLLNEFGSVVYSLSYEGYATGSDRIPTSQGLYYSNAVSLVGTGGEFGDFNNWLRTNLTIGAVNDGQTLEETEDTLAEVWHAPDLWIEPITISDFYMRHPNNAQNKSNLLIHYGFPTNLYTLPGGAVYHRRTGESWTFSPMSFLTGSGDPDGNAYVRGSIPSRFYPRGSTIEYVIETETGGGAPTTFIGVGVTNDYALFDSLAAAQASPFVFTYKVLPEIFIDRISTNASSWIFTTEGNDVVEPFVNFQVYSTTNVLTPIYYIYSNGSIVAVRTNLSPGPGTWSTHSFSNTPMDAFGQNIFYVPKTNDVKRFYRIHSLWP